MTSYCDDSVLQLACCTLLREIVKFRRDRVRELLPEIEQAAARFRLIALDLYQELSADDGLEALLAHLAVEHHTD